MPSRPFPLGQVRLGASIFATAVGANTAYLLSLQPDRLLHNFHRGAGLPPKGEAYGGWEARGIAGHSLGHYLSAVSLAHAQTGQAALRQRAAYVVGELARVQQAHGDGYAGGTTVERDGKTSDGKVVYEELRRGEIRSTGFSLNEGWVPLYTYHKVFAGVLDAHAHAGLAAALPVAVGLGDYLGRILEGLSDAQIQDILRTEHGGLTECYAELYARTRDRRWLTLAQRMRHHALVDVLADGRDVLAGLHANTQIPKIVGEARLHELTGEATHARAAQFFWQAVTHDHSYVIGGNSDHEHFGGPRKLSDRLDQQTCEACNSYNMLRLTRHLYGWNGDPAYFDFYERAHLNHIMAQQDPQTGMFTYFTPLASGMGRAHSTPADDFWCCVGSGMESHAKHGESIYWQRGGAVAINLYYASTLDAPEAGLVMETAFPLEEEVRLRVVRPPHQLALRVPGWCAAPRLTLNGKPAGRRQGGYLMLDGLAAGDNLRLTLPMPLRTQAMPDDDALLAFVSGPLVLAANLGPSSVPWAGTDPALVGEGALVREGVVRPAAGLHHYALRAADGADLALTPFFAQHHNRTAVYFRRFSAAQWQAQAPVLARAAQARAQLAARTLDFIRLGEQQGEVDHAFADSGNTATVPHIVERSRMVSDGFFEFTLVVPTGTAGPLTLQVEYGGRQRDKRFALLVNGQWLATETLPGVPSVARNRRDYGLPAGASGPLRIRFEAQSWQDVEVYSARLLDAPVPIRAKT